METIRAGKLQLPPRHLSGRRIRQQGIRISGPRDLTRLPVSGNRGRVLDRNMGCRSGKGSYASPAECRWHFDPRDCRQSALAPGLPATRAWEEARASHRTYANTHIRATSSRISQPISAACFARRASVLVSDGPNPATRTFPLLTVAASRCSTRSSDQRLMRAEGLEPPRAEAHQDLNLARIPIPPRPREAPNSALNERPMPHRRA